MVFAASALDHVLDTLDWHLIETWHWHIDLEKYLSIEVNGKHYGLTKYSILMIVAALLIAWIYIPLSRKIQTGAAPTGRFWNLFEFLLTFVRDQVAKPLIGKDADQYVPFLWTIFLFVLFCNLLGMIPFLGSPTASMSVTAVLALSVFLFIHINSIIKYGLAAHLMSFAPHLEMNIGMKAVILLILWPIEFLGLIIKCFVLAVRLFANMFAGHIVLGTILLFIPMTKNHGEALYWTVAIPSLLGVFALSFLELFVAFLQAFLFTFLAALFFGGVLEHAGHAAHGHGHDDHGHGHDDHGHGEGTHPGKSDHADHHH
jgi:F-type H+-transporting ATPase subunit a